MWIDARAPAGTRGRGASLPFALRPVSTVADASLPECVPAHGDTEARSVSCLCVGLSVRTGAPALHHTCVVAQQVLLATTVKSFCARVAVAWVAHAWAWSAAGVGMATPGHPAPCPSVTHLAATEARAPARECARVPKVTQASGVPSESASTCPSRWHTRGATRRPCHREYRPTAAPGVGRAARLSDRCTRL